MKSPFIKIPCAINYPHGWQFYLYGWWCSSLVIISHAKLKDIPCRVTAGHLFLLSEKNQGGSCWVFAIDGDTDDGTNIVDISQVPFRAIDLFEGGPPVISVTNRFLWGKLSEEDALQDCLADQDPSPARFDHEFGWTKLKLWKLPIWNLHLVMSRHVNHGSRRLAMEWRHGQSGEAFVPSASEANPDLHYFGPAGRTMPSSPG